MLTCLIRSPCVAALLLAGLLSGATGTASAQDEGEGPTRRHVLEVGVGGGALFATDAPEDVDMRIEGSLRGRLALDITHARFDAAVTMPDPTTPDWLTVRGDGRLLFLAVHDFTWRRSAAGELIRLFAGVGGDIDLPDDVGQLMLSVGVAGVRLGPLEGTSRQLSESYGFYAGLTLRFRIWEIRDELRIAAHGLSFIPEVTPELNIASVLEELEPGATVQNRMYIQAVRAGAFTFGPELVISFEQMLGGPVFVSTLGLMGGLGI
ncbi:MAG: hypothetical protein AB8I08_37785 [Sandaracinaceae bacterium]